MAEIDEIKVSELIEKDILTGEEVMMVVDEIIDDNYKIKLNKLKEFVGGGSSEQVQTDWNQADEQAVDYIKNKPTIPNEQVQTDWNQADEEAVDYIKNKPTILKKSEEIKKVNKIII